MLYIVIYILGIALQVWMFHGWVRDDDKTDYMVMIAMWPFMLCLALALAPFALCMFVLSVLGKRLL
jgi:hypothetical protein